MSRKYLLSAIPVLALAVILAGSLTAIGRAPELPEPISDADQEAAADQSSDLLESLISSGKPDSQLKTDLVFLTPKSSKEVMSYAEDFNLSVEQFQARFPGLDEVLTAGYVVQDGQTFEDALETFTANQGPYLELKLQQLEEALADPDRTEGPEARRSQIANMRAFQRAYEQDGISFSSMKVTATARDLVDLTAGNDDEIVVSVVEE